ncbi:MAG: hypothetical protein O8C66_15830 [Candidatus Methanoperedens sp.]|nr:hypothetical protein [Candidatus Methanoperedens sp.]MCZ7371967.1 hypothetical protein [Candidatus Methanoperedens sp.]
MEKMLCRNNYIFIIEKNEDACNRAKQLDIDHTWKYGYVKHVKSAAIR